MSISEIEENELPNGWSKTTLGEIHIDKSKTIEPLRTPEQVFELYSVPSFANKYPEICLGQEIGSNKQIVTTNTVLVCKINPHINRIWVVGDFTDYEKIASTEWIPFCPVEGIAPHYLSY